MRILFTSAGGRGHSDPLLPLARVARARGHDVVFCCRTPMEPVIAADGFRTVTAGPPIATPDAITPLLPVDTDREYRGIRKGFLRGLPGRRANDVREVCEGFAPAVLVCDDTDFGALVAAEQLDIAYATMSVIAAGSFLHRDVIAEPLHELRAAHDLPPDPELEMLTRFLTLVPGPPRFATPAFPLAATAHHLRPAVLDETTAAIAPAADGACVYFTLGTIFNKESGDLFTRVLAGLRELSNPIIATVGSDLDPARFGPQPAHVRIERYVAQASVLPAARAVVSHGGSGTVLGAIAFGVPSVLLPMGADQPFNAARCEALGIARVLDAVACTPDDVREAVADVLSDDTYRAAAASLRDEARALPGAEYAADLVERLAMERAPITREP